ncbi:helix-turn-helix domain-containing protein [Pedobacter sp. WC2501]|uniref:helix-turn-helix domain-containing protein n=1 Tax=Pedobacter sp. WC2501 TaxID=3461400 RepID=UPI0040464DFF
MGQVNKINTEASYQSVMAKIDGLMAKGSGNVSADELAEIRRLALSAQAYEQELYVVDAPSTLSGMIEMRMFEMKLRQVDLAKKLRVSPAKLSLILNGKQKADVDFLKAVHTELKVDANFILEHV